MIKWERAEPTEEMETVVEFVRSQGNLNWGEGDKLSWAYKPDGRITVFRDPVYLGSLEITALKFAVDNTTEPPYEFLFEPWTQTYLTRAG